MRTDLTMATRAANHRTAASDRQDRYLGWGEDQCMWKYLHRAGARVGLYRADSSDCAAGSCGNCSGDADCDYRRELRRRLLRRIVDDDVPSRAIWVRTPEDPEMIFTLDPPPDPATQGPSPPVERAP